MQKKRNGFLTFCFACLPGAGHMFLGFFKEGISLMAAFFGLLSLISWLGLEASTFLLPVIWCYSFFDALNKNSLPDEEFQSLEDHYLFVDSIEEFKNFSITKYRTVIAIIIILLGLNLLMSNIFSSFALFSYVFSYEIHQLFFQYIPKMIIAVLIIAAGFYLISGKKQTLNQDMKEDPMPFNQENPESFSQEDFHNDQGGDV